MLQDRVSALRKANIYERQRYRHIVGLPVVLGQDGGAATVETPFLIVRIMRDGAMDAVRHRLLPRQGRDRRRGRARASPSASWCATARRFDTLVAIPL